MGRSSRLARVKRDSHRFVLNVLGFLVRVIRTGEVVTHGGCLAVARLGKKEHGVLE